MRLLANCYTPFTFTFNVTDFAGSLVTTSRPSCFVLQTSMDRCTQFALHPLRNVKSVQLVVQEMAESAVVLPRVTDDTSGSIQNSLELVCGGLGCPSENGVAIVHA